MGSERKDRPEYLALKRDDANIKLPGEVRQPIPKVNTEEPSLVDIMKVLLHAQSDGKERGKQLKTVHAKVSVMMQNMISMSEEVQNHIDQIKILEARNKNLEEALYRQNARIMHISNDQLQERNIQRIYSIIFTGVKTTIQSPPAEVQNELQTILNILNANNFTRQEYQRYKLGYWDSPEINIRTREDMRRNPCERI